MVKSTEPLTKKELGQLLEALPNFKPREGYYESLDPVKVVHFFSGDRGPPLGPRRSGEDGT